MSDIAECINGSITGRKPRALGPTLVHAAGYAAATMRENDLVAVDRMVNYFE
jgi:hypothetical protein